MEINKLTKRVKNLHKIQEIVQISKFDALHKLAKAQMKRKYHFDIIHKTLEVLAFLNKSHNLKTPLQPPKKAKEKPKTLWVFFTIKTPILQISYRGYEKLILENMDVKRDHIITIGTHAKNFAKRHKMRIFHSFDAFNHQNNQMISLLNGAVFSQLFKEVKLVSYARNTQNAIRSIFPIVLDQKAGKERSHLRKTRFFPDTKTTLENLVNAYVANVVNVVFQESYEYFYRSKLLKNEESLTNINALLKEIQGQINKVKRAKITNELISIGQIRKAELKNG